MTIVGQKTLSKKSISNMYGFATRNKIPCEPWRDRKNRFVVSELFAQTTEQVGIVPAEHGCVVLDLDMKHGANGRKELFAKFPNLPQSMNYKTASGGFHLWYTVPCGSLIPQATGKLAGVDIRYADGYVCVGKDYSILLDGQIEECPDYLLRWLQDNKKKYRTHLSYENKQINKYGGIRRKYDLSPIPIGQRNTGLYSWGYGLVQGVNNNEISVQDFHDLMHLRGRISKSPYAEVELIISSLVSHLTHIV
jgi:hypothetical protein